MTNTSTLIELLDFDYSKIPRGPFICASHLHHYFQLDVIIAGRVTICMEGERPLHAKSGDGLLIPPLLRHSYESHEGFSQGSFKFHLNPACWSLFDTHYRRVHIPPEIKRLIHHAAQRFRAAAPLSSQHVASVATLCLIKFLGTNSPSTEPVDHLDSFRRSLWPLLEHITKTPYDGWSVSRMARECHRSPDYFSRCFRQLLLGQTPQQYLLQTRMRAAATDVLAGHPIKDVAESAKYATVHAFSHAFKKAMGISPAAYRQSRSKF